MNSPAVNQPVAVPSLADDESRRLAARMRELVAAMAATPGIDTFAATGWLPDSFFDDFTDSGPKAAVKICVQAALTGKPCPGALKVRLP